MTFSKG